MFRIRVEATSANVCVGFDVLGLALNLYNEFTFKEADDFSFVGFETEFANKKNNLVYDSYINVMSNGYDDSIYCENIIGGREFIHGEKDLLHHLLYQ